MQEVGHRPEARAVLPARLQLPRVRPVRRAVRQVRAVVVAAATSLSSCRIRRRMRHRTHDRRAVRRHGLPRWLSRS